MLIANRKMKITDPRSWVSCSVLRDMVCWMILSSALRGRLLRMCLLWMVSRKCLAPASKYYSGICALNNQVVFFSVDTHQMGNLYNRAACNLKPHWQISLNMDDSMTRVFIFSSPSNPKNNKNVWACLHHGHWQLGLSNVKLQVQKMYIQRRVMVTGLGHRRM